MIDSYELTCLIRDGRSLPEGLIGAIQDDTMKSALRSYQIAIDLLQAAACAIEARIDLYRWDDLPLDYTEVPDNIHHKQDL